MNQKSYPIPQSLMQGLVNYLQTKPWAEVNAMMVQLSQIATAIDNPGPLPPSNPNGGVGEAVPASDDTKHKH